MGAAAAGTSATSVADMSETRDDLVYQKVLASMADGVMSLGLDGVIETFNPSAARILKRDPDQVIGKTFAELFLTEEGLDEFNELVLKAIYESETTHSQEVIVTLGTAERWLMVSTTFLRAGVNLSAPKLGVIVVFSDMTERRRRKRVERLFGSYVDPRIVERLMSHGEIEGRGVRREMTVLFCDMQGFTRIVEGTGAEDLIAFVNLYLTTMSEAVARYAGVTDKFIGDAVMAFWGPPFTDADDHAVAACRAALEQRRALETLRHRVASELDLAVRPEEIEIRCGIATGEVVAGNVGSPRSRNYTVIGDTVNVAARLEAAGKELSSRILVSERTFVAARDHFTFRPVAEMALRGRAQRENVYELLPGADADTDGDTKSPEGALATGDTAAD